MKEEYIIKHLENEITIDDVVSCVCRYYGISEHRLKEKCRKREVVAPRQMAMFICNKVLDPKYTTFEVGKALGKKNHATVTFASTTVSGLIETEPEKKAEFIAIRKMLLEIQK